MDSYQLPPLIAVGAATTAAIVRGGRRGRTVVEPEALSPSQLADCRTAPFHRDEPSDRLPLAILANHIHRQLLRTEWICWRRFSMGTFGEKAKRTTYP